MRVKEKIIKYIPYIMLIAMIVPTLYVSMYARPIVDDFDYGLYTHAVVKNNGGVIELIKTAIETCRWVYMTFQGTYSSCFLMSLHPGIFSEELYWLTTWILVCVIFLGFFAFFQSIKRNILKNKEFKSLYWTLMSTVVVVLGMPSPSQGVYWYVGAIHYIPWMMLLVCNIGLLLGIYYNPNPLYRKLYIFLSCVCSFLISGGNQVTAFANILILAMVTALLSIRTKNYSMLYSFFVAVIGFVIMWIAPGNAVRQSVFNRPGILKTMIMSALYVVKWTMEWINGVSIAIIIVFLPLILILAKTIKDTILSRNPLVVFLSTAMIFCGMACVPFYGMGGFGDGRTINVFWIYFMIALLFNFICILGCLEQKIKIVSKLTTVISSQKEWLRAICFIGCLIIIGLFSSGANGEYSTSVKAIREFANGEMHTYAMECDERFKLYNDTSIRDVEVEPLSAQPSLLFVNDIGNDPGLWPNTSIALYYNKDTIKLKEKGEN